VIATPVVFLCLVAFAIPLAASDFSEVSVLAYVGPGAGLGMIGSLLAVLAAVVIGVIGLVLYPITLIRKMLRKQKVTQPAETGQTGAK